ncbi:MAG: hypothetical protein GF333_03480, partial [Candidatus Omnitrophica bacterium]|nr:hypothetical protein [Candidatus Omnitrophota bacterium]
MRNHLERFGVSREIGRNYEEIIYSTALLYNIIVGRVTEYLKQYRLSIGQLNI